MPIFVNEIHDQPKGTEMVLISTHTIMIFMTWIGVEVRVGLNKGLGLHLGVKVLTGQLRAKMFILFISECLVYVCFNAPYFYFYQRPDSLVN